MNEKWTIAFDSPFQQMVNFFLYVPQFFVKDNPTNIITSLWVETNLSYQSFSYLIQQL